MKNILIMTSNEGVSGYDNIDRGYTEHVARMLANDVNRVAKAVLERKLKVYVCHMKCEENPTSYKFYGNFLSEGITVITLGAIQEILPNCEGVFLIGLPAKVGTEGAFLDSTISDFGIYDYKIDNQSKGLIGICKEFFSSNNIPVVMSSGCNAACKEAKAEGISECIVTKTARYSARNFADLRRVEEVGAELYATAKRVLENIPQKSKQAKKRVTVDIEFIREDYLEMYLYKNKKLERVDSRNARMVFEVDNEIGRFLI